MLGQSNEARSRKPLDDRLGPRTLRHSLERRMAVNRTDSQDLTCCVEAWNYIQRTSVDPEKFAQPTSLGTQFCVLRTLFGLVLLIATPLAGCNRAGTVSSTLMADVSSAIGEPALSRAKTGLKFSSSGRIDLGYVAPGTSAEETVVLHNDGPEALTLHQIRTSCECLKALFPVSKIEPGGTIPVVIRLDLSKDKYFVGALSMTVEALDSSDVQIAAACVAVTVDAIADASVRLADGPISAVGTTVSLYRRSATTDDH